MKEVGDVKNVKDPFLSKSLRALPFAPRGRRLVDETLRDWEHESAAPSDHRWLVGARGIASATRAVTSAILLDLISLPFAWLTGRLAVFAVLPAAVLVLVNVPINDPRETFTLA